MGIYGIRSEYSAVYSPSMKKHETITHRYIILLHMCLSILHRCAALLLFGVARRW